MTIFLIIIGVIIFFWFVATAGKSQEVDKTVQRFGPKQNYKYAPTIRMLNRDGDRNEDEWYTYIAGINYHANRSDIGGFSGWVEWDATNTHDSKAMGIYASSGKLLGYIPADERDEYRQWCDAQPQPCMGYILNEDGKMKGRVKILRPCNEEFLRTEFTRFAQWVSENHGDKYVPRRIDFNVE